MQCRIIGCFHKNKNPHQKSGHWWNDFGICMCCMFELQWLNLGDKLFWQKRYEIRNKIQCVITEKIKEHPYQEISYIDRWPWRENES